MTLDEVFAAYQAAHQVFAAAKYEYTLHERHARALEQVMDAAQSRRNEARQQLREMVEGKAA